jgi:hypothetical protein
MTQDTLCGIKITIYRTTSSKNKQFTLGNIKNILTMKLSNYIYYSTILTNNVTQEPHN